MKTKLKQSPDTGCMSTLPPWAKLKTKQAAYFLGIRAGCEEGQQLAEANLKERQIKLDEQKIRLEALKNITQAGSCIAESMSKAYLSFHNHL